MINIADVLKVVLPVDHTAYTQISETRVKTVIIANNIGALVIEITEKTYRTST